MRRRSLISLALLTVAPLTQALPAQAATPAAQLTSYERKVLDLTNGERHRRGLHSVYPAPCASYYAQRWSRHLRNAGALSHQSLTPILRDCRGSVAGENVAYGNVSPAGLVAMWMRSSGHRANILNPHFNRLGVGVVGTSSGRVYATQDFYRAT